MVELPFVLVVDPCKIFSFMVLTPILEPEIVLSEPVMTFALEMGVHVLGDARGFKLLVPVFVITVSFTLLWVPVELAYIKGNM